MKALCGVWLQVSFGIINNSAAVCISWYDTGLCLREHL
jgi:hypothetical protein